MSKIAIKVENLSKKYTIGSNVHHTLRHTIADFFKPSKKEDFWALKDIGAGKSTLLKILSKITHPTTGTIQMDGRVSSLLEVGTGFHPELTGRENIFLNGSLLGMNRSEINSKLEEIIDFSGVEKFIDTPVKHYSSGMYVRLAFSVAAHLNTEILLVDEVLAVGDAEFQKKCLGKMDEVAEKGNTVFLVSHNLQAIKKLTSKCLHIDQGRILNTIESSNLSLNYLSKNVETQQLDNISKKHFELSNIVVNNSEKEIYFKQKIEITFDITSKSDFDRKSIMVGIDNMLSERVFTSLSHEADFWFSAKEGETNNVYFEIPSKINLVPGSYSIVIGIIDPPYHLVEKTYIKNKINIIEYKKDGSRFEGLLGPVVIDPVWKIKK